MPSLQLDPESIAARFRDQAGTRPWPGLPAFILRGVLGFTLVSVAGFAPWAFFGQWLHQWGGEAGLYAVCAAVFIGLSGPCLHRLIQGRGSLWRFYAVFTPAFLLYAAIWTLCWMQWRGDKGSLTGLLGGTAAMAVVLALAFRALREWPVITVALFALNAAGYFAGGWVEARLVLEHRLLAMMLWGVCYGLGFGAGLGVAFWLCQQRARVLSTGA